MRTFLDRIRDQKFKEVEKRKEKISENVLVVLYNPHALNYWIN